MSFNVELAEAIGGFRQDPLGYVMFNFPWTSEAGIQQVELKEPYKSRYNSEFGPDVWACEFLDDLGKEIRDRGFDGSSPVLPIKFTTASGHGIGKSALVAWLIKFIHDTRPLSKGIVTAGTADQLKTKTWAELGKWHKMSLTHSWSTYTSGRGSMALVSNHVNKQGHTLKEQWRVDAHTCKEENSESFAGNHAAASTSFYIFDEASAVPDKIFEVREGGTTDGEPMIFDFGNPTKNTGRFYENCEGRYRHRYKVRKIDSRSVAITGKPGIQEWIADYGEDSDFVKVRVRGEFPSLGSLQFMPSDLVERAMKRNVEKDRYASLVIGVDVARFGDDASVIYPRIGVDARSFPFKRFRGLDTVQLVGMVIEEIRFFASMGMPCRGLFIDGGGIGGGVVDQLTHLGYAPIEVGFGTSPNDKSTYRYKGDELWGNLKDALGRGLCLPDSIDLRQELTQRQFGYTIDGTRMHLESKKDMKARLGSDTSPDIADALALTYAQEIAPSVLPVGQQGKLLQTIHEYNPLEANW